MTHNVYFSISQNTFDIAKIPVTVSLSLCSNCDFISSFVSLVPDLRKRQEFPAVLSHQFSPQLFQFHLPQHLRIEPTYDRKMYKKLKLVILMKYLPQSSPSLLHKFPEGWAPLSSFPHPLLHFRYRHTPKYHNKPQLRGRPHCKSPARTYHREHM